MRYGAALGVGLLTWLLAGCIGGTPAGAPAWMQRKPTLPVPTGPDSVQMDIALLECPLADAYINTGLWGSADEQIIGPERQAALGENGFHIGQIGGLIPDELQNLLVSKRSNANPIKRMVTAGHEAALDLGPDRDRCRCRVRQNGQAEEIRLGKAQCQLLITPTLTGDGKVHLRFTPRIEHGDQVPHFKPAADGSGFIMEVERSKQNYPALAWEITLAPNQYVIVGARFDHPGTLGFVSFVQADGVTNVQRLLVIRTSRPGAAPAAAFDDDTAVSRLAPPLALQAVSSRQAAGGRSP